MQMLKNYTAFLLLCLSFGLFVTSCKDKPVNDADLNLVRHLDNEVAYKWNETFLKVERYAAGYRPGPAPAALAYMGLAAYEGVISGMPDYNSMANLYPGLSIPQVDPLQVYYWPEVINASNAYLMAKFFVNVPQAQFNRIGILETDLENKYRAEQPADVIDRSKAHGQAVAAAMWAYENTDAVGHDHYKNPFQGYDWTQHQGIGQWVPTFPGPGKPMGAVWGNARTFATPNASLLCLPPLAYSEDPNSALYKQAVEVYNQNTPTLSYEGKWVGEYWSDDLINVTFSPGPRWLAIGDEVMKQENSNLETAVFLNVKMGMALNDAAVGAWRSKFHYNVERPQTYINRVLVPGGNWKPALNNPYTGDIGVTPSFPAYPSGHSTMGGAGAEVLASIYGYNYAMIDRCHEGRDADFYGMPRSFDNFKQMADENAWSRVPLGVHFLMDCTEGVRFGTDIAAAVNALPWKK